MKNKNILTAVAVILVILIGIVIWRSSDKEATLVPVVDMSTSTAVAKLTAATWVWTGTFMNDGSSSITPRQANAFTVTFTEDGSVSGTTDCNSFMGAYSVNVGGAISFGPLGMTKMFCQGSQESAFVGAIAQASSTNFTDAGDLVLNLAMDSGNMTFRQKASPSIPVVRSSDEPVGFANLSYRLIGYKNMSMPTGNDYILTFSGSNGISAKFCNSMSGTYSESKGKITANLISTLMFCGEPDGLMDVEAAFATALSEGVTPIIQGNYLALTDKDWNRFTFELVRKR
ncbi:MAG: META domain-containing protein [bacterium]|nr:META domain-containing protein [bacterium]